MLIRDLRVLLAAGSVQEVDRLRGKVFRIHQHLGPGGKDQARATDLIDSAAVVADAETN